MIARAVVGRWDSRHDWEERPGWSSDWDALRRAMPQHYLMDLIEETWRGPIYSTLFARVWDVDDETKEVTGPASHYAKPIERAVWENSLDSWFRKQLDREQRSRPYIRAVDRAFLRFVYTGVVSHLHDRKVQFELEHLYPVSRLKISIPADGPGWPISCVANLALFTKALNREKSSLTIAEYLREKQLPSKEQATLEKLLFCKAEEIAVRPEGLTREDYLRFLSRRWQQMKQALYDSLDVAE